MPRLFGFNTGRGHRRADDGASPEIIQSGVGLVRPVGFHVRPSPGGGGQRQADGLLVEQHRLLARDERGVELGAAFGLVLLAFGRDDQAQVTRWIALVGALVSFLITLPLYAQFDNASAAMQFVENLPWIERFNVNYHLGVDGISLWFVVLTAFINLVVVIASWESITVKVQQYMAAFLILSGLMIGVFCALDGMLFYVFFEATLIP
eukprot:gene39521-52104_t